MKLVLPLVVVAALCVFVSGELIISGAYNSVNGMCLAEYSNNLYGFHFKWPNVTKLDQSTWAQSVVATFADNANPLQVYPVLVGTKACFPGYPALLEANTQKKILCVDLVSGEYTQTDTFALSDVTPGFNGVFFKDPAGSALFYRVGVDTSTFAFYKLVVDSTGAPTSTQSSLASPFDDKVIEWAVTPSSGNTVYLANSTCIAMFDTSANSVSSYSCLTGGNTMGGGNAGSGNLPFLTRDEKYLVVPAFANGLNYLLKIQVSDMSVVGNLSIQCTKAAVNARGDYIYCAYVNAQTLKQIVLSTFTVATTVTVWDLDGSLYQMLIPTAGGYAYMSAPNSATFDIRRYDLDCPTKGQYMAQFGNATSCAVCADGFYAQSVSALSCTTCPSGATCSNGLCSGSSDCVFYSAASALQALGSMTLLGLAVLISMTSRAF